MQSIPPLDLTAILLMIRTDLGSQLLLRVPQSLKDAESPSPASAKSTAPSTAPASSPLILSAPSKASAQLTPALGPPSGTLLPSKPAALKVSSAPKSLQPQLNGRAQEGAATVSTDMSDAKLEQFLVPDVSNYDKPFEVGIGDVLFVGFPTTIPVDDERRRKLEQLSQRELTKFPLLLMVNVIFVLRRGVDLHKVKNQFSRVSSLYAATLAHEEMHRCFLAIETHKIMRTKELLRKSPPKDSAAFEKALTKNSALASQLLNLLLRLRVCGQASLVVNSWSLVSLSLSPVPSVSEDDLRPYQALIITDDDLTEFPGQVAPELELFIAHAKPTNSFVDIYLLTGIPLQHLYKMACHLVYWKCAMIINVITGDSIFTFNPNPSIPICSPPVTLTQKFLKDCSDSPDHIDNPLNVLLSLRQIQPLRQHLAETARNNTQVPAAAMESFFMEALVWALRHSIVVQLHTFYVTTFDEACEVEAAGKPPEDVAEFLRLAPLLNGDNHFEELVFRTSKTPDELERLFTAFADFVVKIVQ